MNVPRLIAWRYLRRPTDALVSAVGLVSVFGLIIGVMALVISMALMSGYRRDLQRKLLGGNAEVYVYGAGGSASDVSSLIDAIGKTHGVAEAAPVIFHAVVVSTEKNSTGSEVTMKGIDPQRARSSPMLAKIVGESRRFATKDGERGVAVGKYLAARLGVESGSAISVTAPSSTPSGIVPRTATFLVTNIFDTGFYEYDARWLFIDLQEAEVLLGRPGANLIEVKLQEGADLDAVVKSIRVRTGERYAVSDWREMNRQLFSMLKVQQLVLFIVIGLIVFVSTFNIVSTLIMTVHEKRKEIGILTSMGARHSLIRSVFLWYGSMVGFAGTGAGILLGTLVCWLMTRFELVSFPPEIAEVYFVSSIPFVARPVDLAAITIFSLVVSFTATVIPSMRAARLNPVDALRHE